MRLRTNRRGFPYDPTQPDYKDDDRRYIVRLGELGYFSKDHWYRPVPKTKATWLTRVNAERVRHALAKPRMGLRYATIEELQESDKSGDK